MNITLKDLLKDKLNTQLISADYLVDYILNQGDTFTEYNGSMYNYITTTECFDANSKEFDQFQKALNSLESIVYNTPNGELKNKLNEILNSDNDNIYFKDITDMIFNSQDWDNYTQKCDNGQNLRAAADSVIDELKEQCEDPEPKDLTNFWLVSQEIADTLIKYDPDILILYHDQTKTYYIALETAPCYVNIQC